MITIRKSEDRGHANFGWLNAKHSFSFGRYYDPAHMGFGPLRVINEDRIQAGRGFEPHPHQDMEIITYVLDGSLAHKDSMGFGSTIRNGDLQRMSAGTGVVHSEFNASPIEQLHLLQIWLLPAKNGIKPDYEEKHFAPEERTNQLRLVVSPDGAENSLRINQDARLYASLLDGKVTHRFDDGRLGWVQLAKGEVSLNGQALKAGDGAAIRDVSDLTIEGNGAEFLLFDMAA